MVEGDIPGSRGQFVHWVHTASTDSHANSHANSLSFTDAHTDACAHAGHPGHCDRSGRNPNSRVAHSYERSHRHANFDTNTYSNGCANTNTYSSDDKYSAAGITGRGCAPERRAG